MKEQKKKISLPRRNWPVNLATRVRRSAKMYSRRRAQRDSPDED